MVLFGSSRCTTGAVETVGPEDAGGRSPPEAPGILLVEVGELVPASNQTDEEVLPVSVETNDDSEPKEDLGIDERVATLFDVFTSIPGKEIETDQ
ncbi:hypothetical protein Tco_0461023, partial [Tanacetum coccineum]